MSKVSVFGLGYVGCVSAACFAKEGHTVLGVDVSATKVDLVNSGKATIVEEGIGELVEKMVAAGRLTATTDSAEAVRNTEISLIAVGTPSRSNGSLDLSYIERVCTQIGEALREKDETHIVVIRSTVLPGTVHGVVVPALERGSGKKAGEGFHAVSNPEFLREGSSIKDFYDPPFTLIGADSKEAADKVAGLYAGIESPVHVVSTRVAEMVKYACNAFHGLKVGFANEIGNIAKALDVDSHEVMRLVCEDRKLNISPAYLKPGFAFGGSCLPKDLRAVTYRAKELDVETPILSATLESNRKQIERAYHMVMATGNRRVGVLGMAFKAGTDDLRESPMVALIEMLIGKGMELSIYDGHVSKAQLMGSNREFIEREIPHVWTLMKPTVEDVLKSSDTLVIGNASGEFRALGARLDGEHAVVDLARIFATGVEVPERYEGISW